MSSQTLTIQLMTTLGCHLCEDAQVMLHYYQDQNLNSFKLELLEILEDESLIAQYAVRIPVLLKPQTSEELAWPFNMQQLAEFIRG
jgi:hypothetical protein